MSDPRDSDSARPLPSEARGRRGPHRPHFPLPAVSVWLGVLSLAFFWFFELGFILGMIAAVCGALATSRPTVAEDEAASLRALLAIVTGVAGITAACAIALFPTLQAL
ncbi:hypothetical protein [Rhodococcus sp. B50]|uniref:hypothetical protein n=1 Tax=Rhodococcus sp. B50 TaxID=2682847 RepID=UPI001FCFD9DC|nr:hypothetical protein [Rhodococcus sp. B50]MBS9372086.1 hypothetical protein [Rhodococcus sp. B50]